MDLDLAGQIELRGAAQSLAQDFFLDLELVFVAGVLIMASAALAEVGTGGCDAVRGRFDDRVGVGAGEAGFLFGERGFDFFSGKNKGYEDGLAAAVFVGGETSQSVAAVDQLFDGEEEERILQRFPVMLDSLHAAEATKSPCHAERGTSSRTRLLVRSRSIPTPFQLFPALIASRGTSPRRGQSNGDCAVR